MHDPVTSTLVFAFGAAIGSFLNVCIYRLPAEESVITPRSRCPHCKTPIRAIDNIPIVSYLALRGRCRSCAARISPRYALVEMLTGVLAVILFRHFGPAPAFMLYFAFAAALVVITFIDIDHQIIPDSISLPGIGIGLTASFIVNGTPTPMQSAIGIIVGGGILYAVAAGYEWWTGVEGMGLGDVKLLAMIGAFLGWRAVPVSLLLGSLLGAAFGLSAMLLMGKDRRFPIPFGPFLATGALAALLHGEELTRWYLDSLAG